MAVLESVHDGWMGEESSNGKGHPRKRTIDRAGRERRGIRRQEGLVRIGPSAATDDFLLFSDAEMPRANC